MRGYFPTSAACVKCPPPQDRSPSLDLWFREKRLAGQPPPLRRAQTLKSPPNRVFYEFSLRAQNMSKDPKAPDSVSRSSDSSIPFDILHLGPEIHTTELTKGPN